MAVVDRVGEPGNAEFEFALCGFDVEGVFFVPGIDSVTCFFLNQWCLYKTERGAYRSK